MFDITALSTVVIPIVGFVTVIAVIRFAAGGDPADLAALFGRPWELAWPRGVQEEEPEPWRLERLESLDRRRSPDASPRRLRVASEAPTRVADCEARNAAA